MNAFAELTPSMLGRIRHDLVGLKMPRALEALEGGYFIAPAGAVTSKASRSGSGRDCSEAQAPSWAGRARVAQ